MGELVRTSPYSAGSILGWLCGVAQPLSQRNDTQLLNTATSLLYGPDAVLYQSTQTTLRLAKSNLSKLLYKKR